MSLAPSKIRPNTVSLVQVSEPAAAIISTADMKSYLRIDGSAEDSLIDALISAATKQAEAYTGRRFITQSLKLIMDFFPVDQPARFGGYGAVNPYGYLGTSHPIQLPCLPIQSVTSVVYYLSDNTTQTYSADNYYLTNDGRIVPNDSATFPVDLRDQAAVEVTFVAGYGDAASDVPSDIIEAVKQIVAGMYEGREVDCHKPCCANMLLSSYKLPKGIGFLDNGM